MTRPFSSSRNRQNRRHAPYRLQLERLEERVLLNAGDLDLTFSGDGLLQSAGLTTVNDLVVQPDAKILAIGSGGSDMVVERYNSDGSLDASFGGDGSVHVDFLGGPDEATAAVLQPDGKILVVGTYFYVIEFGSFGPLGLNKAGMIRLNPDGTLDDSFGTDGRVMEDFFGSNQVYDVKLLPGGKFLMGARFFFGEFGGTPQSTIAAVRFNADGTRDTTFGGNGDGIAGFNTFDESVSTSDGVKIGLLSTGKFIVMASRENFSDDNDVGLFRFDANGTLDGTFGVGGAVITNVTPGRDDIPRAVAILSDDSILVGGSTASVGTGNFDFMLLKYTSAGVLDVNFDGDGIVTRDIQGSDQSYDLAIHPDGKIVLFGQDGDRDFTLARFNANGSPDAIFGTNGVVSVDNAAFLSNATVAIQPDDKILTGAAGTTARFEGTQTPGRLEFSMASYEVDENAGTATITVARTGGSDGAVSVIAESVAAGSSATAGTDYTTTSTTLNFGDEVTTRTFTIPIGDQAAAEGLETVNLQVRTPGGGATLGAQNTAVLTIFDGPGQFQFSTKVFSGSEDEPFAQVTITRSGGSDGAVNVTLTTTNGTAAAGADYTTTTGPIGFADRQLQATVNIPLLDDNLLEGMETALLTLSNPTGGATLGSRTSATLQLFDAEPGVGLNAGALDASFGTGGATTVDFGGLETVYDVARQSDGKFVVVGDRTSTADPDGPRDFFVARFNSDGLLDTNFGTGGVTITDFSSREDSAQSVVIQSDNKIVVVGFSVDVGKASDFALARYDINGMLDPNFGTGGKVLTNFGTAQFASTDDRAFDVVLDNLQKIIVVGSTGNVFFRDFAAARYTTTGALDNTFDGDGKVSTDIGGVNGFDVARAVAIDGNNKIVAAGSATITADNNENIAVVRYSTNGGLDTTFDTDGKAISEGDPSSGGDDFVNAIAIQPDNKIIVAGQSSFPDELQLTRFNADGAIDREFAQSGHLSTGYGDEVQDLALAPDGKIIAVGAGNSFNSTGILRLDGKGVFDPSFGASGAVDVPNIGVAAATALLPDGKIVTANVFNGDVRIARYLGETAGPPEGLFLFSVVETTTNEGGTATITVTRGQKTSKGVVTVAFRTEDGTALAGSDYTPASGTLTFQDTETTKTFTVPILNDTDFEGDEHVMLILSSPTGGAFLGSQSSARIRIPRNDGVTLPQFSISAVSVQETAGIATITVQRRDFNNQAPGTATIDFNTLAGTASEGDDFLPVLGTLMFANNETTKTFTVPILADTVIETDEVFTVQLSNPTGNGILNSFSATDDVIILDTDPSICVNAGTLDASFGTGGIKTTDVNASNPDEIFVTAFDGNGLVVAAGTSRVSNTDSRFALVRYQATGALDPTFGTGGITATDVGNQFDAIRGLSFLGTGKILVFGTTENNDFTRYVIARYNANGTLDATFGTNGFVFFARGGAIFGATPLVAVQSDGKFVVGDTGDNDDPGFEDDFALMRFNTDGSLDAMFGDGGLVSIDYGFSFESVAAVGVQPNDKIVVVDSNEQIYRFTTAGVLDTTFGGDGLIQPTFTDFFVDYNKLLFPSDDSILAVGSGFGFNANNDFGGIIVARILDNGAVDMNFGTGGLAQANFAAPGSFAFVNVSSAALESNGRIIVAGEVSGDFALARFYPDGVVDIGFGAKGRVVTDISSGSFDSANDVLVTPLGHILAAGTDGNRFALAQYVGGTSPGEFRFLAGAMQVNEDAGTIAVTIERTCGGDGAVSVDFTTLQNGTAFDGPDFTGVQQTINFADREILKTINVPIINDANADGNLTFGIMLQSPQGGAGLETPNSAVVTIVDDENPGKIQFTSITFSANENVAGSVAQITLERVGGKGGAVSAQLAPANGSAQAPADFDNSVILVSFANQQTTATVSIPLVNDPDFEGNETVNLALQNPTGGATFGFRDKARLTIVDDEVAQPGTFNFTAAALNANEADGFATITVNRTGGSAGDATVPFSIANGTAISSADFAAYDGSLLFLAGQTTKTFRVSINNDTLAEAPETVLLSLQNPSLGGLGTAAATLTIADDDGGPTAQADLAFVNPSAAPDPVVAGSNLTFTVTLVNQGPDPATNVVGTVAVPGNTTFVSFTQPAGVNCSTPAVGGTGSVTCTAPAADVNDPADFTLRVNVNANTAPGTIITSTASVTSDTADPNSTNNSVSRDVTVQAAGCSLIVTTTADTDNAADAVNSMREAINCSNASVGVFDTITFAISGGGVQTINVGSTGLGALPTVTDPVLINGYSQTGATVNTLATGNNAVLRVELNGTSAGPAANGLLINAGGTTVRGLVINRFGNDGIRLEPGLATGSGGGNVIEGNFIGTNPAGAADLGNGDDGVDIRGTPNNTIGGPTAAARNLLSGNGALGDSEGVYLFGPNSTGNRIENNYIGTNAAGTAAIGNSDDGIDADSASNNTIINNLISGNDDDGVEFDGGGDIAQGDAMGNLVQGNFIGTNAAGTAAIANATDGVSIQGASLNSIGGTTVAARNVISGNGFDGVFLVGFGATQNLIQGNFIGTNAAGTGDLGNGDDGVDLDGGPSNNTIGGLTAGAGNVISGNAENGVTLQGDIEFGGSNNNFVQGNFIGTDVTGTLDRHNDSAGIDIRDSFNNRIERNIIAFNQSAASDTGVAVFSGTGNSIRANSMFKNVGLGIDLLDDGVTINDAGDVDGLANNLLNFPVLESATVAGGNLTITGFARPDVEIDFFIVDADPTGFGEGKTFLTTRQEGSGDDTDATTGTYGPGNVNGLNQGTDTTNRFRFVIPVASLPTAVTGDTVLTSTATEALAARGGLIVGSTSEFSGNITVQGPVTQFDFGDAANTYSTLLSSNGPRHALGSGLAFSCDSSTGAVAVDADPDGQPSTFADGDDLDADGFDEEGVQLSPLTPGTTVSVTICATAAGRVDAFIDFNDDGDFADSGEKILNNVVITAGTDIFNFSVPASATGGADGVTFSRFRISTAGGLSFTGAATDGEVEDHSVDIVTPPEFDFGDAPASYGNPSHELTFGPILGDDIDSEASGQPSGTATGDDNAATDDETGVTFVGPILIGGVANVDVEVKFCCLRGKSESALLDAFLDFNGDGDFADPGEKIFDSQLVFEGTNSLSFPVPSDADTGFTFARFRVSSAGDLSFDGPVADGEVEDYRVRIIGGEGGCEDFALDLPEIDGEGNVKARVSGGVLRVRGDAFGNGLVIEAGDGPDSFRITPLGGTTLNRQFGSVEFVGASRGIQVGLLGGPDVLVIDGASAELVVSGKLRIRSGTSSTAIIDRALSLFDDHDIVAIVDALLESGLTVKLRRGADDLTLCGVEALHRVRTGEGLGPDLLTVDDSTFDSRYNSGVGVGQDVISIEQHGNVGGPSTEFNGKTKLRGRKGNDAICIGIAGEPGNSANFHGKTKIRGGRGRHDSLDGLNTGANTFDTPPMVVGIEQVDAGSEACGLVG